MQNFLSHISSCVYIDLRISSLSFFIENGHRGAEYGPGKVFHRLSPKSRYCKKVEFCVTQNRYEWSWFYDLDSEVKIYQSYLLN